MNACSLNENNTEQETVKLNFERGSEVMKPPANAHHR
jgi:hypothetical protein